MASSQTFLAPKSLAQQPNKIVITADLLQQIKRKVEEMGPGPFTPEQQKQRENYLRYFNVDNQSTQNVNIQQQQHQSASSSDQTNPNPTNTAQVI